MFDFEGIHQAIYIVAEHKFILLSGERHQLLMTTAKRRNSDIFFERTPFLGLDLRKSDFFLDSSWTAPDREKDRSARPV